jgi:hypothetical protein
LIWISALEQCYIPATCAGPAGKEAARRAIKEARMIQRRTLTAMVALLIASASVSAQTVPVRFHWQAGQVLTYRVEQVTTETEVVGGTKVESALKLNHVKRWQVIAVDGAGVATIQQSLGSLRVEKKTGNGTTVVFDSANPEKSDPPMREQLSKYVGTVLAVLRIDSFGKVVEVTKSSFVAPSRYENELPFTILLPVQGLEPGKSWQRTYDITLDPPLGTGEKYPAAQEYYYKGVNGELVIAYETHIKSPPADKGDQAKILQFLPRGEAVFDVQSGCLRRVRQTVDQQIKGHQGEDSSYSIQTSYVEELVGN